MTPSFKKFSRALHLNLTALHMDIGNPSQRREFSTNFFFFFFFFFFIFFSLEADEFSCGSWLGYPYRASSSNHPRSSKPS